MNLDSTHGGGELKDVLIYIEHGAKLSLTLFEIASKLDMDDHLLQSIGIEISLLCSVARKLELAIRYLEPSPPSNIVMETTSAILVRCSSIFRHLDSLVAPLSHLSVDEQYEYVLESKLELQVQHTTLESCKITLNLIMATLDFAARKTLRPKEEVDVLTTDDRNEEPLLVALIAALQTSVLRLEHLEIELASLAISEAKPDAMEPRGLPDGPRTKLHPQPTPERASKWLQSFLPFQVGKHATRPSNTTLASQMPKLLARWINLPDSHTPSNATVPAESSSLSTNIFKSFRIPMDSPCHRVLPAVVEKFNINADWREYDLLVIHGDQERRIGWDEQPLMIFKGLDREGKKPMFCLRQKKQKDLMEAEPGEHSSAIASTVFAEPEPEPEPNHHSLQESQPNSLSGAMSPTSWSLVDAEDLESGSELPALPQ